MRIMFHGNEYLSISEVSLTKTFSVKERFGRSTTEVTLTKVEGFCPRDFHVETGVDPVEHDNVNAYLFSTKRYAVENVYCFYSPRHDRYYFAKGGENYENTVFSPSIAHRGINTQFDQIIDEMILEVENDSSFSMPTLNLAGKSFIDTYDYVNYIVFDDDDDEAECGAEDDEDECGAEDDEDECGAEEDEDEDALNVKDLVLRKFLKMDGYAVSNLEEIPKEFTRWVYNIDIEVFDLLDDFYQKYEAPEEKYLGLLKETYCRENLRRCDAMVFLRNLKYRDCTTNYDFYYTSSKIIVTIAQ